jgi:hypothetical protein
MPWAGGSKEAVVSGSLHTGRPCRTGENTTNACFIGQDRIIRLSSSQCSRLSSRSPPFLRFIQRFRALETAIGLRRVQSRPEANHPSVVWELPFSQGVFHSSDPTSIDQAAPSPIGLSLALPVAKTHISKIADPTSALLRRYISKSAEPVPSFYYSFYRSLLYLYGVPLSLARSGCLLGGDESRPMSGEGGRDRRAQILSRVTAPKDGRLFLGVSEVAWTPDRAS